MDKKESEHHEGDQLLPRDRLSTLPDEILSEIFKLAYTPGSPPTGPICRALLPFDRSTRFRRLEVKSVEKLRKLAELVEKGALGGYVRELKLEEVDSESAPGLKDRQLKSFFANLPHLSHLQLGKGCQLTLRLILSNSLARASLRYVTHLATEAVESKNPFDPAPYRLFNSYPALRSLNITSDISWNDLKRIKLPKKKVEPLSGLVDLAFTSKGADLPLVSFFVQACPSLQALSLSVTSWPADFQPLLPLLPSTLKSLELRTIPSQPSNPNQPCDALLSRFTHLKHLYLGDGLFRPNILDLVRTFPNLTSFGLGEEAAIACNDLLNFVDGPDRFVQLKVLTLDIAEGKRGWRVHEDGKGVLHPDADRDRYFIGPGWVYPRFPGGFDDVKAGEMIKAAKRNGIEVRGTTEEAVEISLDHRCEICTTTEVYGWETGDWSELRMLMGDEYVDDLLMEFDLEFGSEFDSEYGDYGDYEGEL